MCRARTEFRKSNEIVLPKVHSAVLSSTLSASLFIVNKFYRFVKSKRDRERERKENNKEILYFGITDLELLIISY